MTRYILATMITICLTTCAPTSLQADSPRNLKIGNMDLKLNGAGYRKKTLISLYECGLYLQQGSRDAAAIIQANQPMAIRIRISSGFVSQSKLVDALNEGFRSATGGQTTAIDEQIQQFRSCFGDAINKNDVFVLVYVPQAGVVVLKNGQQKGVIPGLEFKQALFGIWLSDHSVDESLKSSMLGR